MNVGRKSLLVALLLGGMSTSAAVQAKRAAPKNAAPVVAGGVRYTVPHWAAFHDKQQNGGYVQAWDVKTKGLPRSTADTLGSEHRSS
jgi:hypothetical protein